MTRKAILDLEFRLPNEGGVKKAAQDVSVLKENVARAKKGSLEYVQATRQLDAAQKQTSKSFQETSKSASSFSNTMKTAVRGLTAFLAVGSGIQLLRGAISTIIDFEQSLADLSAITGATGGDLEFYADQAREIGRTTTLSASEAVTAFQLIGSASPDLLKNSEALAAVTKEAVILSEAAGIELPEAAAALGNSINAFRLPAEDAGRIINVLAAASQAGAREIPFVTQALEKFGGTAALAGVSIEESVAAVELLGKTSSDAGGVGTNLRNVITILQQEAAKSGREFKGLSGELETYADKLDDVNFLVKVFGRENLGAAQNLISQRNELENLTATITDTNVAYEQAETRTQTLSAEIQGLKNAFDDVVLGFRESAGTFSRVIRFLRENLQTILRVIGVITAGLIGYRAAILATNAALAASRAITVGYTIAKTLLTQGLRAAVVQVRAFNTALASNPIGLVVGLLATAAAAFFAFRSKAKEATDAQNEFNEAVQRQNQILGRTESLERRVRLIPDLNQADLQSLEADLQGQVRTLSDQRVEIQATISGRSQDLQKEITTLTNELNAIVGNRFDKAGNVVFLDEDVIKENLERAGVIRAEIANLEDQIKNTERRAFREFGTTAEDTAGQLGLLEPGLVAVRERLAELERQSKNSEIIPSGTIAALEARVKELRKVVVEDLRIDSPQFQKGVDQYKSAVAELAEANKLLGDQDAGAVEGSIDFLSNRVNELRNVINATSGEAENYGALVDELIQAQLDLQNLQDRLKPVDRSAIRAKELEEEERHALALLGIAEAGEERQLRLKLSYAQDRLDALKVTNEEEQLEYQKQANAIVELQEQLNKAQRQADEQRNDLLRQQQLEQLETISFVLGESLNALNQLVQGQQAANQRLIQAQQERVNSALQIAETGNVALLNAEQKRLDELQVRREQFVRAQQALAASQLIAESSLAIARAAAEGGALAPFTIAATLLALTAGLAQARAAAQTAAAGFKTGGFTGYGARNDEAGVVHKEEFVIDSDMTREMGLRGKNMAQFREMMQTRKMGLSVGGGNRYEAVSDKQIDRIVQAVKSQPHTEVSVDEHGVFKVIDRSRHYEKRRRKLSGR